MALDARLATMADHAVLAANLGAAFQDDPVWRWAFPDPVRRPEQLEQWWGFFLGEALRYPWTWMLPNAEAVAMWIPPGGTELSPSGEARLKDVTTQIAGDDAPRILFILDQFDAAHPHTEPHYYLSLIGTTPAHRGRGLGMALLAHNLALIDQERMPAYLESSNPGNEPRYEKQGFARIGSFFAGPRGPELTTMWRPAREDGAP